MRLGLQLGRKDKEICGTGGHDARRLAERCAVIAVWWILIVENLTDDSKKGPSCQCFSGDRDRGSEEKVAGAQRGGSWARVKRKKHEDGLVGDRSSCRCRQGQVGCQGGE